jgi:hypothetical protein
MRVTVFAHSARMVGPLDTGSPPPRRPTDWRNAGFERKEFVRWFHPFELVRAGVHALLADLFGSYADKRELQAALATPVAPEKDEHDYSSESPEGSEQAFWFDFVADIGDGFNATYSVATLLAARELEVPGAPKLPRGRLLVMGGDEVYPTASHEEYLNRTIEPYGAALPWLRDERHVPHLFAIPGNHDWYDGLSSFLKQFTQRRWIGAWKTQQSRSYFVLKLPHRYWLWGIDIQLRADIDRPQMDYFSDAAMRLRPGDRVILATAEPSWVKAAEGAPTGFQNLLLILRKVKERQGEVVLVLTGDSHHYARYRDLKSGVDYITAGGGGAFLHGTHALPEMIRFTEKTEDRMRVELELHRKLTYPLAADSRAALRDDVMAFPLINRGFAGFWAVLWAFLAWTLWSRQRPNDSSISSGFIGELAVSFSWDALVARWPAILTLEVLSILAFLVRRKWKIEDTVTAATIGEAGRVHWQMWVDVAIWLAQGCCFTLILTSGRAGEDSPLRLLLRLLPNNPSIALLLVGLVCGSAAYVSRPKGEGRFRVRFALGLGHGFLYILGFLLPALGFACLALWMDRERPEWPECISVVLAHSLPALWIAATALVAAGISTLSFAGFLWFGGQYRRALLNDAFSAIGIEDHKNFLRLRIGPDRKLTVFAIAVPRAIRRWRFAPYADPESPFIVPETGSVQHHLIETIPDMSAQVGASS